MAINNISKGIHTQEKLHLKARKTEEEVTIEAIGEASNIDIVITPKENGRINANGVLIRDNVMTISEIKAGTITANNQIIPVVSLAEGISGHLLNLNSFELGDGVTGDGIAGIKIERGLSPDVYFIFDENENRFKLGELDDLQYLLIADGASFTPGRIFFSSTSTTNDFETNEKFLYDVDTSTLSLSGNFIKNGSPILNKEESDIRYLNITGAETISGDKTFENNIIINGTTEIKNITGNLATFSEITANNTILKNVIINGTTTLLEGISVSGNVGISGNLGVDSTTINFNCEDFNIDVTQNINKNSSPLLNQIECDERYVNTTGTEIISGNKIFSNVADFLDAIHVVGGGEFDNLDIDLNIIKDGKPVLNQTENDERYVNTTGTEIISGNKTFIQDLTTEGTFRIATSGGPAMSGSAGEPGELKWDTENLYICYQQNKWGKLPFEKVW